MTWLWKRLADMPSTNARIFITLLVFSGTAIKYWWTDKVPDTQWLGFIAIMAGVDALQFGAKRATEKPTTTGGKDQEDTAGTLAPKKISDGSWIGMDAKGEPIVKPDERPIVTDNDDGVV